MRPLRPFYLLILIFAFSSCHQRRLGEIIEQADRLLENDPDSAFVLLSSYPYPEKLGKADFAAYQLMYTKAKDKSYMDLSGDTAAILKSLTYYEKQGTSSQRGWSNYYAGRVYKEAGKLFEAGLYFVKAAEYAGEIPDPMMGMMANYYLGGLHDKQYAFDKSLDAYRRAYFIYGETSEQKYNSELLRAIGTEYGILKNHDSAFFYLKKALNIAYEQKDTVDIASVYNDLSVYLREDSQYVEAKAFLQKALLLEEDSVMHIVQKISLANINAFLNDPDSAQLLLNEVKPVVDKSDDIELQAIYYSAWARTEVANKNYEAAYLNQKRYVICVDSVYQLQRKNSLAEVEQIYNYIRFQSENEKLVTRNFRIILFAGVSIVLLIVACITIFRINQKKKQLLVDAEEIIETFRKMQAESHENPDKTGEEEINRKDVSGYSEEEKEKAVKKALLTQLNIAKMLAKLDEKLDKDKSFLEKFNHLFYGGQHTTDVDWPEFYLLINLLYDNFASKLQTIYGNLLLEKEIQLCCLLKANMDTTEIACLMGQSINTVRTRKTSVRKKLNAPDAIDIVLFLNSNLND